MDDFEVSFNNTKRVDAISAVLTSDLFATQAGTSCQTTKSRDRYCYGVFASPLPRPRWPGGPTSPASRRDVTEQDGHDRAFVGPRRFRVLADEGSDDGSDDGPFNNQARHSAAETSDRHDSSDRRSKPCRT